MILPSAESIQIVLPVITILFLLLGFRRPIFGTIGYFIVLNAKLGDMYPALGAIRFELLAAVVAVAAALFSGRGLAAVLPRASGLNKPLWLLFGMAMLSVALSIDASISWEVAGYDFVRMMVFYYMVVAAVRDRSDLVMLTWALVLVTAWLCYEPIVNHLDGIVASKRDYSIGSYGAAVGHVALSNTINQALPFVWFLLRSDARRSRRLLLIAVIALMLACLVVSRSRGGFVGLVVVGVGIAYFSRQRAKAMAAVGVAVVVLLAAAGGKYIDQMATISDGIHHGRSTYDRYLGLRHGIEMLIERPPLGVGIGCYAEARSRYFGYNFFSHNLYGELIGELGVASILWFYWIYCIFKKTAALKRELATDEADIGESLHVNMINAVQLALLLRLIIGNFTHSAFIWFWFLMAGMVVCLERIIHEERDPSQSEHMAEQPAGELIDIPDERRAETGQA